MALNIFKRKHKEEKPASVKTTAGKEEKPEKVEELEVKPKKETKKEEPVSDKPTTGKKATAGKGEKLAWRVIKEPHITEKATLLAERNQYVFKVFPDANKIEIKKAIKEIYGADVEEVRIINVPRKKRRRGRIEGWRKGYKKAIVKIKEGQTIEILPK